MICYGRYALGFGKKVRILMGALIFITILIAFAVGLAVGVIAVVAIAIRREDRVYNLSGTAPDRTAHGARRLTGMYPQSAEHAAKNLQHDRVLGEAWQSANSQIEDTYNLMGPPPSGDDRGGRDE
jgi:hypothetical protein